MLELERDLSIIFVFIAFLNSLAATVDTAPRDVCVNTMFKCRGKSLLQ